MTNKVIARHLALASDLVELTGGNAFRARAFASAARAVERLDMPAEALSLGGTLTAVPGVGKGVAADVAELLGRGTTRSVETLLEALPPGVPELLRIRGLGVKKVRALWQDAGVDSVEALVEAAGAGRLVGLAGFGPKTVEAVLAGAANVLAWRGRAHLRAAWGLAQDVLERLRATGARAEVAGETRRQCNVVGEVVVVTDFSGALPDVVPAVGPDGRGAFASGLALRVVTAAAPDVERVLWEETGPEAHLAAVRARAADRGRRADGHGPTTEAEIYAAAGLAVVPPPLRDDDTWLDAAARDALPRLVRTADLRGTIHNHTTASDGQHTLREMADAAGERGLAYFGVADHSRSLGIANGLSAERLEAQIADVAALNRERGPVRVFSGSEVDVLADGRLDFPDALLARLDVVVASVHQGLVMSRDEATARVVAALSNPYADVLGHATGRLLLRREGYPLDVDAVLDACAAHGVAVELNANPYRLDMDWTHLRGAVRRGLKVSINPDAHAAEGLDDVAWGVASAQKAGLTAADSLTSLDTDAFAAWRDARRAAAGAHG